MSIELKSVQVRLDEEAYAALKLMAGLQDKDLGEVGRELLTAALLGAAHTARMQAERFARALASANKR